MHDPTGRVFRYNLETEQLDCLVDNCPSPNGLALNPEETVLYVGMTRGNVVWRLPILPDGSTSKVGIFTQFVGGVSGADGLAMDVEGNLSVCDAGVDASGCSRSGENRSSGSDPAPAAEPQPTSLTVDLITRRSLSLSLTPERSYRLSYRPKVAGCSD